jgi:hypothetical protein
VGGTEYIIGFEGSQALPVCPSGIKLSPLQAAEDYVSYEAEYQLRIKK